ncbi:MAG: acetyl-CoA carboxylase, carboxyltransferase subunit beta [Candidatus Omnitrophica bacterium]|nr:acetyl-CoA carboxylase carboxyltransferase subunit beta [bacterium]MBK7495618.1 acetyl-CoA carboxylase carboxyltransferase subunit beta [Candidatus Omnitrophota bacterium]MCE7908050.1 acetyl-CoA carboxylase carboxyltransferase subunit beta [Candidatus Omnitrophica bacterium COP1]MBV6482613.1 Acetyl-coenzyme A carboxylase carboxyl transferase subunit beta [bacterium]MCC6733497.1 acetyl-CoA carboxylase carboxyltransferase subunit beta [Candidatus Omnitrophota bacterium]
MSWFRKPPRYTAINKPVKKTDIPDGLWMRCEKCDEMIFKKEWEDNLKVCPKCGCYSLMGARERLSSLIDEGTFIETDASISSIDPLQFQGYAESLAKSRKRTGEKEAIIAGNAQISGHPCEIGVFDFNFMAGSMGSAVGEKVTRTLERGRDKSQPVVIISAGGGGARMHEGILSLMQMAKTSAAVARLRDNGIPFISVITHPTMGGVAASFASLGDIIIAEPGALIGFAGPRVIEQTIGQRLPDDFQTSEFLLKHGMIDMIVPRHDLRSTLGNLLGHLRN